MDLWNKINKKIIISCLKKFDNSKVLPATTTAPKTVKAGANWVIDRYTVAEATNLLNK